MAYNLFNLGLLAFLKNHLKEAQSYLQQSLKITRLEGERGRFAEIFVGIAAIYVRQGRDFHNDNYLSQAARLCGVVETLLVDTGIKLEKMEEEIYQQTLTHLQNDLDETIFLVARVEGHGMLLTEAFELALAEIVKI